MKTLKNNSKITANRNVVITKEEREIEIVRNLGEFCLIKLDGIIYKTNKKNLI